MPCVHADVALWAEAESRKEEQEKAIASNCAYHGSILAHLLMMANQMSGADVGQPSVMIESA